MLVGKGPSAVQANHWRKNGDDVAAVNDSVRYISGRVDYCFFIHDCIPLREFSHRVDKFVSPLESLPNEHWVSSGQYLSYRDSTCCATSEGMAKKIMDGGICHHHTTTAALHWLCKFGKYDLIRVIGIDGGHEYAPGAWTTAHRDVQKKLGENFMDDWKRISLRLCGILTKVYGTEFDWYGH